MKCQNLFYKIRKIFQYHLLKILPRVLSVNVFANKEGLCLLETCSWQSYAIYLTTMVSKHYSAGSFVHADQSLHWALCE